MSVRSKSLITGRLGDQRFISSQLDEQTFSDPWGVGWRVTVLRFDHRRWEEWRKLHLPAPKLRQYADEAALEVSFEMAEEQAPKAGFRTRRRLTRRQGAGKIDSGRIIKRIKEKAGDEGVLSADAEDLAALKPGLLEVGIVRLVRVIEGDETEATPGDVEELLTNFRDDDGGALRYLDEFAAPDEGDDLILVPYGGQHFQDAVTEWLLDCAEYAEAFSSTWVEEARDFLAPTPAGTTDTGSG